MFRKIAYHSKRLDRVNTTGSSTDNDDSLVRLARARLVLGARDYSSDLGLELFLVGSDDDLVAFDLG